MQTGITISPPLLTVVGKAGTQFKTTVAVTNNSSSPITLVPQAAEFRESRLFTKSDSLISGDWLSWGGEQITLEPGNGTNIPLQLDIPTTAAIGNYAPVLIFSSLDAQNTTQNGAVAGTTAQILPGVAVRLNLNVVSELPQRSIEISNLQAPGITFSPSADLVVAVENIVPYSTTPIVYVQLVNPQGAVLSREIINAELQALIPNNTLSKVLGISINEANGIAMPGSYRVEVLALDRQFNTQEFAQASFWYVPAWVLIAAASVFVVTISGATMWRRSRRRLLQST